MAYRAIVNSAEPAANGDVHLDTIIQTDRDGDWTLIPNGHRTLVLDGEAVMAIINNGDTLANRRAAMKALFIEEVKAWGLDESHNAATELEGLMYLGFPQTVDLT